MSNPESDPSSVGPPPTEAPGVATASAMQPARTPPVVVHSPPIPGLGHNGQTWTCGGAPLSSAGLRLGSYLLEGVLIVVTLLIGWFIWALIVWAQGQTPAKQLLGMRCVRTDTAKAAGWGTMFLREVVGKGLLAIITFGITTLVSCFMILGQTRQGVWDKIASTVVVNDKEGLTRS
jgi:uncharacterized RDD family membrane protein YckC